jgi:type III pantothenate kinase
MILTVDIGNTRVKWAQWRADIIVDGAAATYEVDKCLSVFDVLFSTVEKPSKILVACVAGEEMRTYLSTWVKDQWQLDVEYLQTERKYKNILNAYSDPQRHGVDRWAGIVAGHQSFPGCSVCVVGAGTATTFDLVNKDGCHLGGYILPSYATMRASLLADTANVSAVYEEQYSHYGAADNTNDAVNRGCHKLLQAGVREICLSAKGEMDKPMQIVITGGYAKAILQYPDMPEMHHKPDLVMQGLYSIMMHQEKGVKT